MYKNPYILKNGKEHPKYTKTGIWKIRTKHRHDIGLLNSLVLFFKNSNFTVYDFGCGDASYSKTLIENGIDIKCYDGNPNTVTITDGLGEILDLASNFELSLRDWVICFEVGEHIPKEYESKFIENLCKHATKGIILSWASIGQSGSGHVNCQDDTYIRSCLRRYGFVTNKKIENIFKNNIINRKYFRKTIMVFEKLTIEQKSENIKLIKHRSEIPTILKTIGLNKKICELGVFRGKNLWDLAMLSDADLVVGIDAWDQKIDHLWTQETHDQNYNYVMQKVVEKIKRKCHKIDIKILRGDHSILVKEFDNEYFDYVYIDSDHSYECVKKDINQWYPKIKEGGIIAGHDYCKRTVKRDTGTTVFGVIKAVDEFITNNRINNFYVTPLCQSWIIIKE